MGALVTVMVSPHLADGCDVAKDAVAALVADGWILPTKFGAPAIARRLCLHEQGSKLGARHMSTDQTATSKKVDDEAESSPGLLFLGILYNFIDNQEDLLYTAAYIIRQQSEIDDQKEKTWTSLERDFPHVERHVFDASWKTLSTEFSREGVSNGAISSDPGDVSAEKARRAELDTLARLLPDDGWQTYLRIVTAGLQPDRRSRNTTRLLASLLTSLIADFEVLVGNLLRTAISIHPKIISDSGKTYTWAEISQFDSLESFKSAQIDETIDKLLYKSYSEWMDYIAKKLHIPVADLAVSKETMEVFQRRHMIIHNGGKAGQAYIDVVKKSGSKISLEDPLPVDLEYLRAASDRLVAIATHLVFEATNKFEPRPEVRNNVQDSIGAGIVYKLLQDERYDAIVQIRSVIPPDSFGELASSYRYSVNSWLALKRLDALDTCRGEVAEWDTSASDPLFRLAKHALLDELPEGLALVLDLRGTDKLPLRHWLTWPLLNELRDYEREELIGDPLE